MASQTHACELRSSPSEPDCCVTTADQLNLVFLVNFLAPNLHDVMREVASQVGQLTVLCSVAMEGNRQWTQVTDGLNVRVQRSWTFHRKNHHPGGYEDQQYVHIPWDTFGQLRSVQPNCVVSLELGARSLLASLFTRRTSACGHVVSVYASERTEMGRGRIRTWLRRRLVRNSDVVTFNGPSCERYLRSIGTEHGKLMPWNYAADPSKPYRGQLVSGQADVIRMLSVGQLIDRKGILLAAEQVSVFALQNPSIQLNWTVVGTGPLQDQLLAVRRPANLGLTLVSHQDADGLRKLYQQNELLLFPTLGDEWGLVTEEALASGLVVLGSRYSQAVEVLVQDGVNGWQYKPDDEADSFAPWLKRWAQLTPQHQLEMRQQARNSVLHRTPQKAAEQLVAAALQACAVRSRRRGEKQHA